MRSQNDHDPEKAVAKYLMDNLLSFKEMIFESGKQQDNITVWLVGMSTGALALIVSQYGKFSSDSHSALRLTVIFLAGAIISGLLFRIFHLFLQRREHHDLMVTVGWLSGFRDKTTAVPIELPEDSSAEFIAWSVYRLLGLETGPYWKQYVETNDDVEYWRKEYEKAAAAYNGLRDANLQCTLEMVKEVQAFMANLDGEPVEKYQRSLEEDPSRGINKRRLRRLCGALYTVMCISFAVSVLFISWSFINADLKKIHTSAKTSQTVISPAKQAEATGSDVAK